MGDLRDARRRKPHRSSVARLSDQYERARAGGAFHRRLPRVFDAGAGGRATPCTVRDAARAWTDAWPVVAPDPDGRRAARPARFAVRTRARLCAGERRVAFFRQRSGRRLLSWRATARRLRTAGDRAISGARYRRVGVGQSCPRVGGGACAARSGAQSRRRRRCVGAARYAVARFGLSAGCRRAHAGAAVVRCAYRRLSGRCAVAGRRDCADAARDRVDLRRGEPCASARGVAPVRPARWRWRASRMRRAMHRLRWAACCRALR